MSTKFGAIKKTGASVIAEPVKVQAKKSVSKSRSPAKAKSSVSQGKAVKAVEESKVAPAKGK